MESQDQHRPVSGDEGGFALAATLIVLVLMSTLVFAVADGALISTRASTMEYQSSRAFYAAEAGAEVAMAQLEAALEDGAITQAELDSIQPPTISGFSFDNFIVTPVGGLNVRTITDGHFAGLYSLNQALGIYSEASDAIGNSNASIITVNAQAIPIFQFGVFYEKDLEITNGPPMTFAGWVHSNGSIYLSSDNSFYEDVITTPNKLFHDRKDNHNVKNGVWVRDASATDVNLNFDSRSHPVAADFIAESASLFDNRVKTDAYGVDSLNVPLPVGVPPIELVQPRQVSDGPQERRAKFAWKADWYVELDLNGTGGNTCNDMTHARTAGLSLPTNAECNQIFDMSYEIFYEDREAHWADVFEIDINELRDWIDDDPSHNTSNILYITFTGAIAGANDAQGDGAFPVVRLVNGDELPNPLTIASDRAIYIQGDYNTSNWQPAAIAGDAMTWLSNNWSDASNQLPTGLDAAANTEINTAVLVGHSSTPCDHEDGGCVGGNYGGGLENFPRFLESWSGRTMTYKGSLVSLYTSQYSVGDWGYGDPIYQAPGRDWSFDIRFRDPANLPPGTPVVGFVLRTAYRPAPAY